MRPAWFCLLFLSGTFSLGSSVSWQYFYMSQNMAWSDAQTYCRANYIDLVTVRSIEEENNLIALAAATAPGYSGSVWLGLRRTWTWITGEPYSGQVPFYSGQPNEGNDRAACGVLGSSGLGDWFCSTSHYFVCYDDSSSSKFIVVQVAMNWTNAELYCRQRYAHLAVVKFSADQQLISYLGGGGFIGLISARWSDYSFSAFRYWGGMSGQETSLINKCVGMVIPNAGKWEKFDCTTPNPFICYGAPPFQPVSRLYHAVRYLKTWMDAQIYCRVRFTDLATLDSVGDVKSVTNQVDPRYTGLLWIGLQSTVDMHWSWSMGDEPLGDYFNWALNNPTGGGKCVSNMNGLWSDMDCQTLLYFVCYSEGTGYIMVNIQKTWQDAQSYCRSTYTDLARIRSPWEQSQVNAVVGRWVSAWIGLFLDSWQWSDQWSRRFRNWASGPPSVVTAGCAAVVTGTSGRWTNDICTTPHPFVCYGDVDRMNKKQIIRIKLVSSGMTDPSVRAAILDHV
ncbi:macrophage mannose receptor 1-like isoform X2 [Hemibagrus wyckioides]|uniref:macrophage mannose receptor 1-like isoform X2 n=1 Tax=Hemibagrus wyckioides TaxID=337641 RepID=UPI00266BC4CB|nr:macrophage mannose receptor 1-like isoform X2 [Hemibagrus wyckioides]